MPSPSTMTSRSESATSFAYLPAATRRIQSELYIAPGTMNYHARNIYAKLGVHSKQSLIDLVLGYRNAPRRNHVQGKD